MFDQTPINRISEVHWNQRAEHDGPRDNSGVRQLVADIAELGELQARLVADDVRNSIASLATPIILSGLALVVILGTIPVVILALANVLVDYLEWSRQTAQFTCAGIAIMVATALGWAAFHKLRNLSSPLRRSMSEMEKNVDKLKEMLVGKNPIVERFERRDEHR